MTEAKSRIENPCPAWFKATFAAPSPYGALTLEDAAECCESLTTFLKVPRMRAVVRDLLAELDLSAYQQHVRKTHWTAESGWHLVDVLWNSASIILALNRTTLTWEAYLSALIFQAWLAHHGKGLSAWVQEAHRVTSKATYYRCAFPHVEREIKTRLKKFTRRPVAGLALSMEARRRGWGISPNAGDPEALKIAEATYTKVAEDIRSDARAQSDALERQRSVQSQRPSLYFTDIFGLIPEAIQKRYPDMDGAELLARLLDGELDRFAFEVARDVRDDFRAPAATLVDDQHRQMRKAVTVGPFAEPEDAPDHGESYPDAGASVLDRAVYAETLEIFKHDDLVVQILDAVDHGYHTQPEIAEYLGISLRTFQRRLERLREVYGELLERDAGRDAVVARFKAWYRVHPDREDPQPLPPKTKARDLEFAALSARAKAGDADAERQLWEKYRLRLQTA
jgi:hypothetical protein